MGDYHKDVPILLVGTGVLDGPSVTGVLDCPIRYKLLRKRQRLTPTDFQGLLGFAIT